MNRMIINTGVHCPYFYDVLLSVESQLFMGEHGLIQYIVADFIRERMEREALT